MSKLDGEVLNGVQPGGSAGRGAVMPTAGGATGGGEVITKSMDIQSPEFKELVAGMDALKKASRYNQRCKPQATQPHSSKS
jgi:hypothetical protein